MILCAVDYVHGSGLAAQSQLVHNSSWVRSELLWKHRVIIQAAFTPLLQSQPLAISTVCVLKLLMKTTSTAQ